MKIPFTKAHGTGNDFIIFLAEECPDIIRQESFIQAVCSRRTGIGADSVLILENHADFDFKMDYYNSDGSWETMCANGSRCAALFMHERGMVEKQMNFITGDGPHQVEIVSSSQIRLKMTPPKFVTEQVDIGGFIGQHVDSGAAHFVTNVNELSESDARRDAPCIRYSESFQPRGINVNFYTCREGSVIDVLTYEKGIESLMLSCGSGSVAAAYYAGQKHSLSSPIMVNVPGGQLKIEFDPAWKDVWLAGPAVLLFNSKIDDKDLVLK